MILKLIKLCLLMAILCLISGCSTITSINPFYIQDDVITDDSLLGEWKVINQNESSDEETKVNNEEIWTFSKDNETNAYVLSVAFEDNKMLFDAVLFKVRDKCFIDLFPRMINAESNAKSSLLNMHLMPVHTVSKILIDGDNMTLEPLKGEWVKDKIIRKKFNLSYGVTPDNSILVTAETEDIKDFLENHLDEVFGDGDLSFKFERMK